MRRCRDELTASVSVHLTDIPSEICQAAACWVSGLAPTITGSVAANRGSCARCRMLIKLVGLRVGGFSVGRVGAQKANATDAADTQLDVGSLDPTRGSRPRHRNGVCEARPNPTRRALALAGKRPVRPSTTFAPRADLCTPLKSVLSGAQRLGDAPYLGGRTRALRIIGVPRPDRVGAHWECG